MAHWLVIYDIRDTRRLGKVAKVMEQYAIRVQKSVFEMESDDSILKELRGKICAVIDEEDFVVYFKLCEQDWQKRLKFGVGSRISAEDKEFYIL